MTIYKVYTRSVAVGILSGIVYSFIALLLFSLAIEKRPDYPATDGENWWFLLGIILCGYLVYLLARATARQTIRVGIIGKKMVVRHSQGIIATSRPDFELPFYQISTYKDIRKWYGYRLELKLASGTKLLYREKYLPFLRNRPYREFLEHFIKNYETGSNSLPAMRVHLDAYSISEPAISGFAPAADTAEKILPLTQREERVPVAIAETTDQHAADKNVKSIYLKTRRSAHFHFIVGIAAACCIGFGTSIFSIMVSNHGRYAELVFCSLMIVIGLCTIAVYYLNAPLVETDTMGITFRGKTKYWRDINKMEPYGKQPYRYFILSSKDGMMLQFADGSNLYLHDSLYANLSEIRANIENRM